VRAVRLGVWCSLATLLVAATSLHAQTPERNPLQPYQMVRSLQLVQDRIADGDHATLPMQKRLLEIIDARLRVAQQADFEDKRNFHALLVYAMSGGNPATIADLLSRVQLDEENRKVGAGVLGYLIGDVAQSREAMETIDPSAHDKEVGAFLWLVKGSVVAGKDIAQGITMLDRARLVSPGTLIEEAALRRTTTLAVMLKDPVRFISAAEQYARRFLRSPYASQFAEAFVSGIIALRKDGLDLSKVEQTTAWMTREQSKTIYLQLSRRAAIDGDNELLAFASERANQSDEGKDGVFDPRGQLYSSISSVTSDTVEDVLSKLEELDSSRLSARDRALLDAARTIASEVVAPPVGEKATVERPSVDLVEENSLDSDIPPETDALVTSARNQLDAIDKLLEETRQ
jgi:chemotaxis protein MotC